VEASGGACTEHTRDVVLVQAQVLRKIRCAHEVLRGWPILAPAIVKFSAQFLATVMLPRSVALRFGEPRSASIPPAGPS
jgi:hypothetical protein